ncbi:aldose 1-epimerase [Zobellia galactanivorans]|uniref:aldose epimerase family protein n=1 Tax=Zobellia galactanivorans (strain DSM 12802 / CCUG 47099 / CIP 106680 / NCIMB 13871 / Dsij) TaxID=63186 RepID=UPI001C07A3A8|nr:aldose 1-epimerase [Zobellia galactanivorans]MBU3027634.1 aldose 1-epimerase [Zobellia galactanivorans]
MTELSFKDQNVKIDAGELVGYTVNGHEYIHQKGSPGWRSSDTEMFPIIGPTADAKFMVQTPRDIAVQDQHGLLREMEYELISETENEAVFQKAYKANSRVKNSKYPNKSNKEWLFWTYDFNFKKTFRLGEDGLEVSFTVSGERDMPFMLGYHPAFKLHTESPVVIVGDKEISLDEIMAVGSRALEVADCEEIVLKDQKELRIRTEGFGNFMLWTEVPNMLCIEPITFYPYAVPQAKLFEGFSYLKDEDAQLRVFITAVN